jgi:large subunit ribosomal protein L5
MADKKDKQEKPEKAAKGGAPEGAEAKPKTPRGEGKKKKAEAAGGDGSTPKIPIRLQQIFIKEIGPRLRQKFNLKNVNETPKVVKIVVNMGVGEARDNQKHLEKAAEELRDITGQKPQITKARKAISNFKIRAGMNIGCFVTLRGTRMWAFLEKLIGVSLPRVRDFRGVSPNAFDGRGNYNLGIREQLIFPEINPDKVEKTHGMNITIVTTAANDVQARELLTELGMPFRK